MSLLVKETNYLSFKQFEKAWDRLDAPGSLVDWSEVVSYATNGQNSFGREVVNEIEHSFAYKKIAYEDMTNDVILRTLAGVAGIAERVYGLVPRMVQLYAAYSLIKGRIVEQKTGEGKTLVAAMSAVVFALLGCKAIVVTTNDYLAYRDRSFARRLALQFALEVGSVLTTDDFDQKRVAYEQPICYVTHQTFGFDYLHDQLALSKELILQKERDAVIVDEADLVLIDDARTPLILSGSSSESDLVTKELRKKADAIVKSLDVTDVVVDEKFRSVQLTETGVVKAQEAFGIDDLFKKDYVREHHLLHNALQARFLQEENRDYVVREDQIELVDASTGRILEGRRLSEGLHEALEVKHGLEARQETNTHRQITYQELFKKVQHLAGLTGTARPEEDEFYQVYGLEITSVPTYRPVIRDDKADLLFATKKDKWQGVAKAVKEYHENNQPVLIGTISIEDSEAVSHVLTEYGLSHNVLNALNPEAEALIISHGGEHDAITVATNMAGRGVDIKLDELAKASGGLVVIGCDHNRSPRIDNQLRGRSGRQGDPGVSQFFISLEDDFMRQFLTETRTKLLNFAMKDEGVLLSGLQKPLQNQIYKMQLEASALDSSSRTQTARFAQAFLSVSDELNQARYQVLAGTMARSWRLAKSWGDIDDLKAQFDSDTSWATEHDRHEFLKSAVLYAFDVAYREMLENMNVYRTRVSMLGYSGEDIFYRYTQLLRDEVVPTFKQTALSELTDLIQNQRFTTEAVLRRFEAMSAEKQKQYSESIDYLKEQVERNALMDDMKELEQVFLSSVADVKTLQEAPNRKSRRKMEKAKRKHKKGGR